MFPVIVIVTEIIAVPGGSTGHPYKQDSEEKMNFSFHGNTLKKKGGFANNGRASDMTSQRYVLYNI